MRAVLQAAEEHSVVISPDGMRSGTNALLMRPPDALPFAFGPDSFEAHLEAARQRGLEVKICERPHLAFDLDTAGELARLKKAGRLVRERAGGARSRAFPKSAPATT